MTTNQITGFASQAAHKVFAGPVSGGAAAPAFRNFNFTDILSAGTSIGSAWFNVSGACAAGTALTFDSVADQVSCQAYALTAAQVNTAMGYTPANPANYVAKAGDTMTGALVLPSNGLTVGTSEMVVSGSNVGIGSTSPGTKLDVVGSVRVSDQNKYYLGTAGWYYIDSSTVTNKMNIFANNANITLNAITGGVGIGTTAPGSALHVGAGAVASIPNGVGTAFTPQVQNSQTTGVAGLGVTVVDGTNNRRAGLFVDQTNAVWGLSTSYSSGAIPFVINNGGTEQLRITSAGRVGIGTNNPGYQLDMTGSMNLPSTTSSSIGIINKNGARFVHDYAPSGAGGGNIFMGTNAGNFTSSYASGNDGSYNSGFGATSLAALTTGSYNSAFGYSALNNTSSGVRNSGLGGWALGSNSTGNYNTGVGYYTAFWGTTGSSNTSIGYQANYFNTTGSNNVAIGFGAGLGVNTVTVATGEVFVGVNSGKNITNGTYNTGIGYQAAVDVSSGSNNLILGYYPTTGVGITTGSNNIMLGYDVRPPSQTASNQLNIGNLIYATGLGSGATLSTGSVGIGTTSPSAPLHVSTAAVSGNIATFVSTGAGGAGCSIAWNGASCSSDIRLKQDVESTDSRVILNDLLKVRTVHFTWKKDEKHEKQTGFIAQELEKIFPEFVKTQENGYKQVNYAHFVSVLTSSLQEFYRNWQRDSSDLRREIASVKAESLSKDQKIKDLELENVSVKARLDRIEKRLNSNK